MQVSCDSIVPNNKRGCRGPKPSNAHRDWKEVKSRAYKNMPCKGTVTHAKYAKYKAECALVENPCGNVARQY